MIDDVDVGSTKKQLAVDGVVIATAANRRRMAWRTTSDNIMVHLSAVLSTTYTLKDVDDPRIKMQHASYVSRLLVQNTSSSFLATAKIALKS